VFSYLAPADGKSSVYWQAYALHPGTATPVDVQHPASSGEAIEIYGLGLGVTTPKMAGGVASPSNPPAIANVTPTVSIDDASAKVLFAGLAPGFAGVYQINIEVPGGLRAGQHSVIVRIADAPSTGIGTISVK
jgi:uncharacterized protein (TIGR03437 family)